MIFKRIFKRLFTEARIFFPIPKKTKIYPGLIISLTSYPARLKTLHIVIRSLLKQKVSAEKVILYLGTDSKESDIPKKLRKLTKYNFEIKTGYEDLKPHKKYFFAMQEYPNHMILTVDDDSIYDKNLVKDLVECSEKNPGCVCARRVNLITRDSSGKLNPYSDWKWDYKELLIPSDAIIATGCAGVLYPAQSIPREAFDIKTVQENCLTTDDIWLKFMELKNGIKVVFSNSRVGHPLTLRHTQDTGLLQMNTTGINQNDINIKKIQEITGLKLADFCIGVGQS